MPCSRIVRLPRISARASAAPSSGGRGTRRATPDSSTAPASRAGQRLGHHGPDPVGVPGSEPVHVPAGLVPPRPQVVDPGVPRRPNGRPDLLRPLGADPERLDPDLAPGPVPLGEVPDCLGPVAHPRVHRASEPLPVRIGGQGVQAFEARDLLPLRWRVTGVGRRDQAHRAPPAAAMGRPVLSTWDASGWRAVNAVSASPPKIPPTPHGESWTSSPVTRLTSTIRRMVPG